MLFEQYGKLTTVVVPIFQMWFAICERALDGNYRFTNPVAIAGANDYLSRSSRKLKVTKKAVAEQYGISVSTLSKYVDEILDFLPNNEDQ